METVEAAKEAEEKTLITTLSYRVDGELRIADETIDAIKNLHLPDGMVANWQVYTESPWPTPPNSQYHHNIRYNMEKARHNALEGGYDYLLCIEDDIIPPKDALLNMHETLHETEADVVTGIYRLRKQNEDLCLLTESNEDFTITTNEGEELAVAYDPRELTSYKISMLSGEPFKVAGSGIGCILIPRYILEEIPFRYVPNSGEACVDMFFSTDLIRNGYQMYADPRVLCEHISGNEKLMIDEGYWQTTTVFADGNWQPMKNVVDLKEYDKGKDLRLNLGSGRDIKDTEEGWINLDEALVSGDTFQCKLDPYDPSLPFSDNTFVEVYASHFLEHIADRRKIIREIWRVCRDGAKVTMIVPNGEENKNLAWRDPSHYSVWVKDLIKYYTDHRLGKDLNTPVKFDLKEEEITGEEIKWICEVVKS